MEKESKNDKVYEAPTYLEMQLMKGLTLPVAWHTDRLLLCELEFECTSVFQYFTKTVFFCTKTVYELLDSELLVRPHQVVL